MRRGVFFPSHVGHALLDVFLPPPFFRRLGTPGKGSPFDLVFAALRSIPPPAIGVVRVLFCATTRSWGPLMGELIDYEERTLALGHVPKEVLQTAPSAADISVAGRGQRRRWARWQ